MKHTTILKKLLICTTLFIFSLTIIAQPQSNWKGDNIVTNYQYDDYNGGNKIYSIALGTNGLAYLGDKNGVITFDGEKWDKIEIEHQAQHLALDKENKVYIASNSGIGIITQDSLNNNHYKSLNHLVSNENKKSLYKDAKVFRLEDDIIFILKNKIIINSTSKIRIIETRHEFGIVQKVNNKLYLFSSKDGIYCFEKGELSTIHKGIVPSIRTTVGFIESPEGLVLWQSSGKSVLLKEGELIKKDNRSKILSRKVTQIDKHTYAIKTFYSGLILIDQKLEIKQHLTESSNLINNSVLCVTKDKFSNLWVGTSAGLSIVKQDYPITLLNSKEGLGSGYSICTTEDKMIVGTSSGMWYRGMNTENVNTKFKNILKSHILGLSKVDNTIYFGNPSGLYAYKDEKYINIFKESGGAKIKKVPYEENTYLTSIRNGFNILKKSKSGLLKKIRTIEGPNLEFHNFEFDDDGNVWVEYNDGIYSFKWDEPEKIRYHRYSTDKNTLKKIIKYKGEVFFICSKAVYEKSNNDFIFSPTFAALNNSQQKIGNLVVDEKDNIWVFTGKMVYKSEIKNKTLCFKEAKYLSDFYGLFSNGFENVKALKDSSYIIGYENGFIHYSEKNKTTNSKSITKISKIATMKNDNNIIKTFGSENINKDGQSITLNKKIPHSKNSVSFQYSAGYSNYKNVRYRTILEGYNEEWSVWSDATLKEFTNLKPGTYCFKVESINNTHNQNKPAICTFTIATPWYLRPIIKVCYVGGCITIFIFIILYFNYRFNKQDKALKQKEKEYSEQQKQQKKQLKLETDREVIKLKNEKLRTDNIYKSKELANLTYSLIQKNKVLIEFKEELDKIKKLSETNKIMTDDIHTLIRKVNRSIDKEENWEVFEEYFDTVHENFFAKMQKRFPSFTTKDLRLCAYLRMNLTTKEIAPLMNISVRGVEIGRYRLRKKLELDRSDNINNFLNSI